MKTFAELGIIGGTGLGDVLMQEVGAEPIAIDTPYGTPSSDLLIAEWEGVAVAFLSRHGPGHTIGPSHVPYRANIWALKKIGVQRVIASGATGSLREDIEPGQLVICDQIIDKTFRRVPTFFDEGLAVHVEMAEPFCPNLRSVLNHSGVNTSAMVHPTGTYVCMEGPQFSTRAESLMHRQWGADLIGMTCMPEAKLAREAELCYALVALPTDYDCWRPSDPSRGRQDLLAEIIGNLKKASEHAVELIRRAVRGLSETDVPCQCREALRLAIWSDKTRIAPDVRERLTPLIGRYLADSR